MSSRPAWSDAALGSRVADRNVTISVPREIAAALARFCDQKLTGSVTAEFHFNAGALRKVKRGESEEIAT